MKHNPKHRGAPKRPVVPEILESAPRKVVGTTALLGSLAVAATGVTVAGGVAAGSSAGTAPAVNATDPGSQGGSTPIDDLLGHPSAAQLASAPVVRRAPTLSRSADRRDRTDPVKEAALSAEPAGEVETGSKNLAEADPRQVAMALLAEFGFSSDQFGCLDSLYTRESGWNVYADNPSSSAYGIPQALPGSKMASAGPDWATNPVTQIRWGLGYIQDRYGSPCGAWGHSQSYGWY
ncbi:lytic transglycosylase domain-containing protein [Nocardioides rubriscoriae]|uniref:aggregation-promoting factor C-terminal-like domain-containing protein n=1 Tax=Nocardioides rubriscoriae TaxID=642762 RepID=UPI001FEA36E7|nr:lytic transglycosylase domain-containing protein [Nocardioides rubriscoriae]